MISTGIIHILILVVLLFFLYIFYLVKYPSTQYNNSSSEKITSKISTQLLYMYWSFLFSPLFHFFVFCKIKPNHITFISCLVSVLAGVAYAMGSISTAGCLFILSGSLDMIDGRVARHYSIDSKAGAFLDSVLDRYADNFVFAGIILCFSIFQDNNKMFAYNLYIVVIAFLSLLGSSIMSYAKERGRNLGNIDHIVSMGRGYMHRGERVMVLGIGSSLDPFFNFAYYIFSGTPGYYYGLMISLSIVCIMANMTAFFRVKHVFNALKQIEK